MTYVDVFKCDYTCGLQLQQLPTIATGCNAISRDAKNVERESSEKPTVDESNHSRFANQQGQASTTQPGNAVSRQNGE